jgi:hypothetical protein
MNFTAKELQATAAKARLINTPDIINDAILRRAEEGYYCAAFLTTLPNSKIQELRNKGFKLEIQSPYVSISWFPTRSKNSNPRGRKK